jgi:hypothetical protein
MMVTVLPFADFVIGVILQNQVAASADEHILLPRYALSSRLSIRYQSVIIILIGQQ